MKECCGHHEEAVPSRDTRFGRVLWIALLANATMFVVEAGSAWRADSTALLADAADFLGDSANYAVSLLAIGAAAVWRSRVALAKGWTMGAYGTGVLLVAAWQLWRGVTPEPQTMAAVGFLALLVNLGVAALLYTFRTGDANMKAVWLCTRNDAIGNVAVLLAAAGVFGTGSLLPDLAVAALLGVLGLSAARTVVAHARLELRAQAASTHARELSRIKHGGKAGESATSG